MVELLVKRTKKKTKIFCQAYWKAIYQLANEYSSQLEYNKKVPFKKNY